MGQPVRAWCSQSQNRYFGLATPGQQSLRWKSINMRAQRTRNALAAQSPTF